MLKNKYVLSIIDYKAHKLYTPEDEKENMKIKNVEKLKRRWKSKGTHSILKAQTKKEIRFFLGKHTIVCFQSVFFTSFSLSVVVGSR